MPLVQLMIYLLPLQCSLLPFSEAHRRLCNHREVRLARPKGGGGVAGGYNGDSQTHCRTGLSGASFCRKEYLSLVVF